MTNAITILKSTDSHKVFWNESVRRLMKNIDFLELSFNKTKTCQVGLVIKLHGSDYDTLWIDETTYFDKRFKEYSQYCRDMYDIHGVAFKDEKDAHLVCDEIHKQYMWKVLKQG
jgi:hypothetical protein